MDNVRLVFEKQWNKLFQTFLEFKLSVNSYLERGGLKMSPKEFITLIWINLKVRLTSTVEFLKVAFKYYSNIAFMKADLSLRLMYLFHSPYKISKRFLMKKKEADVYAYGETPLTSLRIIATECNIGKNDCVFELGSGRGRVSFWLSCFLNCSVVGIEYIPEFVERANLIVRRLKLPKIEFRQEDMLKADLKGATVCYLYGTCLDDSLIEKLTENFAKLPTGTKIITVSYPLTEYANNDKFAVMKRFKVQYPWGEADVYLQIVS